MDLTRYLTELDGQYRIFDLGRRIRKLDKKQFQQFESTDVPYPFPYLQHAWLGLFIAPKNQPQNETLWFLKWPLDEQGKLIPYVRDDLVQRLLALSKAPLKADTEIEDPLKDNPFAFNPDDTRRANLHALLQAQLHRKPSNHYQVALNYLQAGALNKELLNNWQELGMQGLADVAARQDQHQATLQGTLGHMPPEAYLAFSQCLEHQVLSHKLSDVVSKRFQVDLQKSGNVIAVEAGMRLLGTSLNDQLRIETWQQWMASEYHNQVAVLLTFATRNYDDLAFMPEKITPFLVDLAQVNNTFEGFIKVVGDLLYLPGIRNILLNALRDPKRPEIIAQALQALLVSRRS